jgi:nitrite reductase/ring-hydroxylating ferredoxin subunit
MADEKWIDVGSAEELARSALRSVDAGGTPIALSFQDGAWSAISGACNHVGGPLGDGRLDGDYVVCPWHNWKFHRATGEGEPGFEADLLIRDKVAGFIVVGGQDNVQAVAGQIWGSSPSSGSSSHSSPTSPTRAAGRRRTWRRTWTCCARAVSCATAPPRSPSARPRSRRA